MLLIVDDEEDIRDSLADFFRDAGFVVEVAANGADAWDLMQTRGPPSVLVLDLVMPVMDGGALYGKMMSDPFFATVPVIFATSDPRGAPTGASVMTKPIDLHRLMSAIRVHYQRS
jgi:DNA-binding response OmpR family regulator